jgi:VWFA-related protein
MRRNPMTLVSALVWMVAAGGAAWAQPKTIVKAVAQSSRYPEVEVIVNVRDAASGRGVYGLDKTDFTVAENNDLQEVHGFVVKAAGKVEPIDIVFVFDQTGSMQDEIDAVKENTLMFADILRGSGMDFRLGLVTFSDAVEKVRDLTADAGEFKGWISEIRANAGGDEPENGLAALDRALQFKFRPGAQVVFILITDAPYHQNDPVTSLSMLPLAKKIKLEGIRIYPITVDLAQYQWMARETEGTAFNITKDFSSIIESLAVTLTAQYRLTYVTKNPSFDNTPRNVEVQIKRYGSALASYRSSANITVSSQLIEKNRPSDAYQAAHLTDGKDATCWAEGADGPGVGEWVQFGFDAPKTLKAFQIIAGYTKTDAIYRANNRVKQVKVVFSDGASQVVDLADKSGPQRVLIDRDKPTRSVRFVIMDVYRGSRYNDTCVSEIVFEYK